MESIEIFTAAILIVGALHLVVTAGAGLSLWWNETIFGVHASTKATDAAAHSVGLVSANPRQQRSDWYVYFYCSDLNGPDLQKKKPAIRKDKALPAGTYQQPTKRLSLRAEARR